jgi:pectinesterase
MSIGPDSSIVNRNSRYFAHACTDCGRPAGILACTGGNATFVSATALVYPYTASQSHSSSRSTMWVTMRMRHTALATLLLLLAGRLAGALDITVAAHGRARFRSIQAAVDSVPEGNRERVVIHIRNGTYREELRIHRSFLTLRGEDRKQTVITAEVDTSSCPITADQSKEEQCATVIADGSELVFENLTVTNSFQSAKGKGAALSIVGDGTRIVIANVDVLGSGGDTLVLSARRWKIGDGAEYYLNDVSVSGTYHIIVPRGTTYAVNSRFWCMGGRKNCLFNEGLTSESAKLVIRNSVIDGPEPFGLGSYFRDAAWYFVEDRISGRLLPGGQIWREPAKNYQMKWGEGRIYFADNQAPDYPWLKNNIEQSPARTKTAVTAEWALSGWNPESISAPRIVEVERTSGRVLVKFNESVTVHGVPALALESGAKAVYRRGSGTDSLEFEADSASEPVAVELRGGEIFASSASLRQRHADLSLATAETIR